jgi:hypothetical protein
VLEENRRQAELIQQMRDEIAVLKGQKARPRFKPSGMDAETEPDGDGDGSEGGDGGDGRGLRSRKRAGSSKRSKTQQLTIHQTIKVAPKAPIPERSRFKGYRDFIVQDLRIQAHNTCYRLEVWQTPDGARLLGELPVSLNGGHFGPELRRYALYQHHHCHVTQPLLHEQLREWGIDISVGQINALLSGANAAFFAEKDQLLVTSLEVSRHITVDDSGARHQGHNGYVTQIGNDWFAWFASTASKSRINFLQLLHAGSITYCLNTHALSYLQEERLPKEPLRRLQAHTPATIAAVACWEDHLDALGITCERHRRIATEGALLGGLIEKGFSPELAIISDGAGQFAILLHALCWVHAERLVHKLIPLNERHRQDQERVRGEIWDLYADLKAYRRHPDPALAPALTARSESRRARDTFWDFQVPKMTALGDGLLPRFAPLRAAAAPQARPDGAAWAAHRPFDEWLDAVSDALCISPTLAPGPRPLRHFGDTLAPTATGDYAPSLRSPWRAAHEGPGSSRAGR